MAKTEIKTEITGAVWKVLVKPGDLIAQDDPIIILESMKMEIPMHRSGRRHGCGRAR